MDGRAGNGLPASWKGVPAGTGDFFVHGCHDNGIVDAAPHVPWITLGGGDLDVYVRAFQFVEGDDLYFRLFDRKGFVIFGFFHDQYIIKGLKSDFTSRNAPAVSSQRCAMMRAREKSMRSLPS